MDRVRSTVPEYQTLSFWDLVQPGSDIWRSSFPFSAPTGVWTFSGRVALHLGLPVLKLPPESTILVPNYFQGVEIETLLHNRFKLRFCRIDERLQIDLNDAERKLDDRVSALYVIHYFGWPQAIDPIQAFCRQHGLSLIEDCALSLFSRDAHGWLGSYGDMSIFSVYKTLALPHGGFLVTKGEKARDRLKAAPMMSTTVAISDLLQEHIRASGFWRVEQPVRALSGFVRRTLRWNRTRTVFAGGADWNPRIIEYRASRVTPGLMKTVRPAEVIARRRANFLHLARRLEGRADAFFESLPDGVCPLFFPVMVRDKHEAIAYMADRGVGTVNLWWDNHPACPDELNLAVAPLRHHMLELPIHHDLRTDAVDRVAEAFAAYAAQRPRWK